MEYMFLLFYDAHELAVMCWTVCTACMHLQLAALRVKCSFHLVMCELLFTSGVVVLATYVDN